MIASLAVALAASCLAVDFDGGARPGGVEFPPPPPAAAGSPVPPPQNVILITWDGVRREDFFANKPDPLLSAADTAPLLPLFWGSLAGQGTVWGDFKDAEFRIANIAGISLPAYESIFAGYAQPCLDNDCPRVPVETFPERLVRELGLSRSEVAAFSSWERIALAVESKPGTITVDAGKAGHIRADAETWPLAMSYLAEKRPRFLYISLNDSDDQGHAGDYPGYTASLRRYDGWLAALFTALAGMGDYGANTTVLLSTDHGRGLGEDWKNHNIMRPTALRIFLYARGPKTRRGARGAGTRSHADIRPTVEALLGLPPQACDHCGAPLPETSVLSEPAQIN